MVEVLVELLPLRLDSRDGHPALGLGGHGFSTGFCQRASEDHGRAGRADLLVGCLFDRNGGRFFRHGVSFPVYVLRHLSTADDSSARCLLPRLTSNRGPRKLTIDGQNATKIFRGSECRVEPDAPSTKIST